MTLAVAPPAGTPETQDACGSCGSVRFVERTTLAHKLDDLAAGRRVEQFPDDVIAVLSCALCGSRAGLVAC